MLRKELVERVAASSHFAAAPKLRAFFLYIVDCTLRGQPEDATEQQIGIKVFGRPAGYNSGDDSIVRSQARLLRIKLATYFSTEGQDETQIIEMPKGHYLAVFRERDSASATLTGGAISSATLLRQPVFEPRPAVLPANAKPSSVRWARLRSLGDTALILLILFALSLAFLAGGWSYRHWSTADLRRTELLWSPFFSKLPPTLVIYSNPLFYGTPYTGLKLVDPGSTSANHELEDETYTGTGEAAAIRQLTRFFDAHSADFMLKRSRLVTWDEARSSNLIFVGAPSQNTALQDVPALSQFAIVVDQAGNGSITNRHPLPGEPSSFPTNDKTQETAIVALVPGVESKTHILVISGLTTLGTEAAVEFMCRPENVATLAQQAGTANGQMRPFEAVLQIGISKGVGVSAKLILLHPR